MKIELKNLKIALHMSEETTAFTSDIFVNGIKTGYAKNDGHGGCTNYHAYEGKRDLMAQAERHAETLPSHFYEFGSKKMEIKSNLEHVIDDLVEESLNAKEREKFNKKLLKHMETDICFGVPNSGSYSRIGYGKTPLKAVCLRNLVQVQALVDRIRKEHCKDGVEILNTNLAELGLK